MKYLVIAVCLTLTTIFCAPFAGTPVLAAEKGIVLVAPQKEGGMPLMQALNERKSDRGFGKDNIKEQDLSNILWAAWGVNRNDGKRTVPTARNNQDMILYAAMENGVWRYNAPSHSLEQVLAEDVRAKLGGAPLTLLYAGPAKNEYASMQAGSMYQNVGLYCAGAGLANLVKSSGADTLNNSLPLPKGYKVFIIQNIGYAK